MIQIARGTHARSSNFGLFLFEHSHRLQNSGISISVQATDNKEGSAGQSVAMVTPMRLYVLKLKYDNQLGEEEGDEEKEEAGPQVRDEEAVQETNQNSSVEITAGNFSIPCKV